MQKNRVYYFDVFKYSTITAEQIYPQQKSFLLYDAPLQDYEDKIDSRVPTTFYDPRTKTYAFGVMVIEMYTRK